MPCYDGRDSGRSYERELPNEREEEYKRQIFVLNREKRLEILEKKGEVEVLENQVQDTEQELCKSRDILIKVMEKFEGELPEGLQSVVNEELKLQAKHRLEERDFRLKFLKEEFKNETDKGAKLSLETQIDYIEDLSDEEVIRDRYIF